MPVLIPQGVPEEAAARKALAFEGARRRLVAGRAGRLVLALWGFVSAAFFLGHVGGLPGAVLALALGGLGAAWLERRWVVTAIRKALAETQAELSLGRLPEADGALAAMRRAFWLPRSFARTIAIQRALVAMRQGDLGKARASLDEALAVPTASRDVEARVDREGARALRALVLASSGEIALAERDIEKVRAGDPADEALARVSLAEALLRQRAGDREGVRELLDREAAILREACHPRERVMVRALARWARTARVTPYRHVEAEPTSDEPPVETWVARLAPDLAGFVDASAHVRLGPAPLAPNLAAPTPTHAGLRAIREARGARGSPLWPLVAIAGSAFGAMALMLVLSAPQAAGSAEPGGRGGPASLFAVVALLVVVAIAGNRRETRQRRDRQRLAIERRRARAVSESGTAELVPLTESGDALTAAHACLVLAELSEREGRWDVVLAHTEKGLRKAAKRKDAPRLVADLVALRAFALSICERQGEAEAELASIARGYPHAPRALLRVHLVEAIRRGKLADALAQVERHAADLPLSLREETLVDMIRVVCGATGTTPADATRIAGELARDPSLRAWLERVAPSLVVRFDGAADDPPSRLRVATQCTTPGPAARLDADRFLEEAAEAEAGAAAEVIAVDRHHGSSSASTARLTS